MAPDAAARRRAAVLAGHRGDEAAARALLDDDEPDVRAAAMGALARMQVLAPPDVTGALADRDARVRRRACEVAAALAGKEVVPRLRSLLDDPDPWVVEMAAWALGEHGAAAGTAVEELSGVAAGHPDPLCRESAVAALGAIGDRRGLSAILGATTDRPAVRRRAVIALAPFSGPEVDAALEAALGDRDWQVRQAAEDLSGRH